MKTTEERFWEKVDKSGDCWIWQAFKNKKGYGMFSIDGKPQYAHRVAWFLEHGYYPELPMQINHICNNRGCVNPEHLYEGTQEQNVNDALMLGSFDNIHKGETNGRAKLTQEQVDEIRMESTGEWGEQTRMAKKYRVSRTQITNILNNKIWVKQ